MGYVTKSRTRAVGADLRVRGVIKEGDVVDMTEFDFGGTHSAVWRWSNQSSCRFWKKIFENLELEK